MAHEKDRKKWIKNDQFLSKFIYKKRYKNEDKKTEENKLKNYLKKRWAKLTKFLI